MPGQGVQKVGMLDPWLEAFPSTAKHLLDEIDHLMGYKLSDIIHNGPSRVLTATANAQPAIGKGQIFYCCKRNAMSSDANFVKT